MPSSGASTELRADPVDITRYFMLKCDVTQCSRKRTVNECFWRLGCPDAQSEINIKLLGVQANRLDPYCFCSVYFYFNYNYYIIIVIVMICFTLRYQHRSLIKLCKIKVT